MNSILERILTAPILHFVALGVITFIVYANLKPPDRDTIHITTQTIDALVQQQESITQNPVTEDRRKAIIAGHIENEILLREAYKRGFDKNDSRVRKRLLNVMRSSLTEVIPEPSTAQLRVFYEDNKATYLTSPSRSFEQVFFDFASEKLPDNPERFMEQLGRMTDVSKAGDFAILGNIMQKNSFQTVAMTFGKPFAESVFDLSLNQWQGPLKSFRGIHYVRVLAKHDPELPPFENMEFYLRTDYLLQKSREGIGNKIGELGQSYEVIVEGR